MSCCKPDRNIISIISILKNVLDFQSHVSERLQLTDNTQGLLWDDILVLSHVIKVPSIVGDAL